MNENLEYRIGRLEIDPMDLENTDFSIPYSHRFVVELSDERITSIYVGRKSTHQDVVEKFGLNDKNIVGGGFAYTKAGQFVLGGYSRKYLGISKNAAESFAQLMLPELEKNGIRVNGYRTNISTRFLNDFWT